MTGSVEMWVSLQCDTQVAHIYRSAVNMAAGELCSYRKLNRGQERERESCRIMGSHVICDIVVQYCNIT